MRNSKIPRVTELSWCCLLDSLKIWILFYPQGPWTSDESTVMISINNKTVPHEFLNGTIIKIPLSSVRARKKVPRIHPPSGLYMFIIKEKEGKQYPLEPMSVNLIHSSNDDRYAWYMDFYSNENPIKAVRTCAYCSNVEDIRCYRHERILTQYPSGSGENNWRIFFYAEDIFRISIICMGDGTFGLEKLFEWILGGMNVRRIFVIASRNFLMISWSQFQWIENFL